MSPKLNSHQLRALDPTQAKSLQTKLKRNPLVLVLENIVDTYNIGSFFRLADALAVTKIYLPPCAVTPPNLKIHRASVGTWKLVDWEQYTDIKSCLSSLHASGYTSYAVELDPKATSYLKTKYKFPAALVLGSESLGISTDTRKLCHHLVEIPQWGFNQSLNVLVAGALVGYKILENKS